MLKRCQKSKVIPLGNISHIVDCLTKVTKEKNECKFHMGFRKLSQDLYIHYHTPIKESPEPDMFFKIS